MPYRLKDALLGFMSGRKGGENGGNFGKGGGILIKSFMLNCRHLKSARKAKKLEEIKREDNFISFVSAIQRVSYIKEPWER